VSTPVEGLVVRPATVEDVPVLADLYRRSSLNNEHDRAALLASPDALVWSGEAIEDGHTQVAVDAAGRILGFATAVPQGDGLELDDLFVDPAAMRGGVATRLIASIAAQGARDGYGWIDVTANPHAAQFYASAGFAEVGTAHTRFGDAPRLRRPLA